MDDFKRAFYEVAFELVFLKKTGDEYQSFFCEIMEKRYPSDFIRTRPWGNIGDRKNDGYLASKRMLFQVYAPNEMEASKAIAKIDEDYTGALEYWEKYFDKWIFTHNARKGLGPEIVEKLLALNGRKMPEVSHWGFPELRLEIFGLSDNDIASILGNAPTPLNVLRVGFKDLKIVLGHIARHAMSPNQDISPVSPNKLTYNDLSAGVQLLLNTGMQRAERVDEFFRKWHDPTYGDGIAQAFSVKYGELKTSGHTPDEIFAQLQDFALGERRGTPDEEAATLAVLAYLFEKCDIFERPPQEIEL